MPATNDSIISDPVEIEKRSFEILSQAMGDKTLGPNAEIIKRVVHTTADFDYVDNLVFSAQVLERTVDLVGRGGFHVVTDTRMAEAGINKRSLAKLRGVIHCFIDRPEVAETAAKTGSTRSAAAVDFAVQKLTTQDSGPMLFVIGNAPTALVRLHDSIIAGSCRPDLVVGVPVGFVNVVESKRLIMNLDIPFIVSMGRKGGSNVAAAIFNAIMYEAGARE